MLVHNKLRLAFSLCGISFAVLIMFMLWLYAGWLVLLLGASVAFYHQHRECLGLLPHEVRLSNRLRERVALSVALLVADSHLRGARPWTAQMLSRRVGVPMAPLLPLLKAMARSGVLLAPAGDEGPWVPARDLAELRVLDVLTAVRGAFEAAHLGLERMRFTQPVEALASRTEEAAADIVRDISLREWALECAAAVSPGDGPARGPQATVDGVGDTATAAPANTIPLNEHKRGGGSGR